MTEATLFILLVALVLDWFFGEPEILWSRIVHPVVLFGKTVSWVEHSFNLTSDSDAQKYKKGSIAIAGLVLAVVVLGYILDRLFGFLGVLGSALEVVVVFSLLAQRSLFDHVNAVAKGLLEQGLSGGREAVGLIVGRDPQLLDQSGICRAAIESLAENYSDGVVAPAFWYAVFGLPGLFAYKMINTADSMIGYRNERYLWFGSTAAKIDDLANWLPARISVLFLAIGAGTVLGMRSLKSAFACAFRDSGLHRSPNAGWPEAAMAGGAGLALGGPREYPGETVQQSYINSSGKRSLTGKDIEFTLGIFSRACFALWGAVLVLILLF